MVMVIVLFPFSFKLNFIRMFANMNCRTLYQNHHSSQERTIYGASCLLLTFLSPTTCHLSYLRSIKLICSLLAFHFLPLLRLYIGHRGLSSTYLTKKMMVTISMIIAIPIVTIKGIFVALFMHMARRWSRLIQSRILRCF